MTTNTKIVAAAFVASISLTWGIPSFSHYLRDAFFWKELSENPEIIAAFAKQSELEQRFLEAVPLLKESEIPLIESKAAFSLFVKKDGSQKTLFVKNGDEAFPIASLTKLMTSLVAMQAYSLDERIQISEEAVATEGIQGNFSEGEVFAVRDLLYPLLMESSNDAAMALAEEKGLSSFVKLMNGTARILHMEKTNFFNPTGLDPEGENNEINSASVKDLAVLVKHLKESKPELFDILSLEEFGLKDANGMFHHTIVNTNEFLNDHEFQTKVLGGKTGYTEKARGCLIIILQSPKNRGYIINVVLGSENRFEEMKKLIRFAYEGYVW